MVDWRIKDYETVCFNLLNKIVPFEAKEVEIRRRTKEIMRKRKCDKLAALKILKGQLFAELIKKTRH